MENPEVRLADLLGSSRAMEEIRDFVRKAARVYAPVVILGETGTGKSLLGRIIHAESHRGRGPYQAVNCAGIPDSLFESEFFGHQRGAFTGASAGRRGLLEQAHGGTLFLDEVGELTVGQQAKLLTALEEGEIRRLGGEGVRRVDVRILAATSRDLAGEMRRGRFRRDLFHRLSVLSCRLPPLRDRKGDIVALARRFLHRHQRRHGFPEHPLPDDGRAFLQSLPWPGNIRELSHFLEAALILSAGAVLTREGLEGARRTLGAGPEETPGPPAREGERDAEGEEDGFVSEGEKDGPSPGRKRSEPPARYSFSGTPEEEREVIRRALGRNRGNKSRTARELGMARNTLRSKLRGYGLDS